MQNTRKIVLLQTTEYFEANHVLLENQFSFGETYGTSTALLKINDYIINAIDRNMVTIMILICHGLFVTLTMT